MLVQKCTQTLPADKRRYFPDTNLQGVSDRCLQIACDGNTSAAIRDLRQRLRDSSDTC